MFLRSLRAIAACSEIDGAVLLVPGGYVVEATEWSRTVMPGPRLIGVRVGGGSRQESVRRGLEAVPEGTELVLCHDAARPFAAPGLFRRVIRAMAAADGAVPVVPIPDTVKRVSDGLIVETIPRTELGIAQTPQAFSAQVLRSVHVHPWSAGREATDDATLLEAAGFRVVAVEGEPGNFKITTDDDFRRAERLLQELVGHSP